MDSHDFLDTAADLIAGNRESDWRSAVSRAYYGVLMIARELFEVCHFVLPNDGTVHGFILDRLRHCGHSPLEVRNSDLRRLRQFRNLADYDGQARLDHLTAVSLCDVADDLANTLDVALASPTILVAITTETADHERRTFSFTNHRPPAPPTPLASTPSTP